MKKRIFLFFIIAVLLFDLPVFAAEPAQIPGNESSTGGSEEGGTYIPADAPALTANSAILMDMDTGDILYEKNPHKRSEPASTTKLMTALLVVDHLSFKDKLTVSDGALDGISYDAVTIGLSPGETMSVEDLLFAMLLPSANDAANVLAMGVSNTVGSFVKEMNSTAESLGCTETHFANANGLPDPEHYTTVYDMALIARAAYGKSRIRDIICQESHWIPATNLVGERELWTTNQMLYSITDYYYEPCTGGKTGYTESAGNTMVAFAEKDGRRLVSVCFGCPTAGDRYIDSATLLEFGFTAYHKIAPLSDFKLSEAEETANPVLENYYARLPHSLPEFTLDTSLILYTRTSVSADDIEKTVTYNVNKSQTEVGNVTLSYKGQTLATVPIVSDQTHMAEDLSTLNLNKRNNSSITTTPAPTRSEIFRDVLKESMPRFVICLILAIGLCLGTILVVQHRRKKRVTVHRYFGDGPVPARDGPEVMEEIRKQKAQREYLATIEDESELPKLRVPERLKTQEHEDTGSDGYEDTGAASPRKNPARKKEEPADEYEDTGIPEPRKTAATRQKAVTKVKDTDDTQEDTGSASRRKKTARDSEDPYVDEG